MAKEAVKTWSTPVTGEKQARIPCALCGAVHGGVGGAVPGDAARGGVFEDYLSCGGFSYVRCKNCGLVQMNPQPAPEEVRRRYREGHGDDYLSYELANEASFLRLQELSLAGAGFYRLEQPFLPVPPGTERPRILDIGCATGALLEKLRVRGWDVRGIEISGPQAEYARRVRGLDILELPLEENRLPDRFFQAVLASHLIEHLNSPASFVREAARILAPGGRLYISTPNIAGFQARLFRERWRSAIFDHLYLFSVRTLSALLRSAGFTIEKVQTWGGLAAGTAPAPVKRLADRAAKRFGFGDVMLVRALQTPQSPI
ncbi:MAG: class I SAM-dependent methyltransferase [Treponema sp.]|jgi:SAM-dependent methyltransferase|nr:class I SAM-dependent methyltransferase [Treponema sp.]